MAQTVYDSSSSKTQAALHLYFISKGLDYQKKHRFGLGEGVCYENLWLLMALERQLCKNCKNTSVIINTINTFK